MDAHLVAYEYGSGAVWGYVLSHTVDEISRQMPEVVVHDAPPSWMTVEEVSALRLHAVELGSPNCLDLLLQNQTRRILSLAS